MQDAICEVLLYGSLSMIGLGLILKILVFFIELSEPAKWVKLVPYTRIVRETILYTGNILSDKKIKSYPYFQILYYGHKQRAGMFNGQVVIYLKSNPDIYSLVDTVLHEVKHYEQSLTDKQFKYYDEYTNKHGYWNNRFEIEARDFASKHCESCLKTLESKKLIKKGVL